jgi:Tfp pilus assembly pilus retraction ATPase PilT
LANALSVLARKAERRTLLDLARDPRYGPSRTAFVNAMRRWKDPDADVFIIEALNDADIAYAAIEAAATRHLHCALARIAELEQSSNKEIARAAKRARKKLAAGT